MATAVRRSRRLSAVLAGAAVALVVAAAQPASAAVPISPNDPLYPQQWATRTVRAPEAWAFGPARSAPVVAVLDTGVDANNADLRDAVLPGKSFVNDGAVGDPNGHGTAVAGVIAARGNNGVGIAGYCWTCRILPVRVLDRNAGGNASVVAQGVRWAADNGASVINLSLVMLGTSTDLEGAIAYARSRGAVVVAAAGNGGGSAPTYPAASPGAIGVVGTDPSDAPYPWADRGTWADLAAPGCAQTSQIGGVFAESCGSSIAAPAAAGVIALARAVFPSATPDDIDAALDVSSKPLPGVARAGRIDAAALLARLQARLESKLATTRVAGGNRIETAVALSQLAHETATDVVIATGDAYADALSASALAGHVDGPVLLTSGSGLSPPVADEIRRLHASTAWIIGGEGAVPRSVADGLRAIGIRTVHRLGGLTRYHTAAAVALAVGSDKVIVTQGHSWADAAAASELAALEGRPILLAERDTLPPVTRDALVTLGVRDAIVVGRPSVITDAVLTAIRGTGAATRRVAGNDGSTTSTALGDLSVAAGAQPDEIWLATGGNWPDALAAGPAAAANNAVLLVVDGTSTLGMTATLDWFETQSASPDRFVVIGGEASLPSTTMVWFQSAAVAP